MPRSAFCIFASFLVSLPAYGQEFSDTELSVLQAIREGDLGLVRTYVDQYQYYYELPADAITPEYVWRGALLWRYDGQQIYSEEPEEPQEAVLFVEPDVVLTGLDYDADAYFGVGYGDRTDEYGRRWVLDYVDTEAARAVHISNDAAADELNGFSESGVEPNPGVAYNPNDPLEEMVFLRSWTAISCNGDPKAIADHSNGAFVLANPTPMNSRQRKIVLVLGNERCTGTMVDDNSVLTAAHCTTNSSGVDHPALSFTVCSMENLDENTTGLNQADCVQVADVDTNPNWVDDSPLEVEEDYALLNLKVALDVGYMELSSAADSVINGPTDYHRGYPGSNRDCSFNQTSDPTLTTDDDQPGAELYMADGDIQSTPVGYIKWDTSDGAGSSGGPHFYCPNNGDCDMGHFLTGVHSILSICANPPCATGYTAGPKARDIETWVDNNM